MKDLAAFVDGAEEDFVCVNKLGYRLPVTLDLEANAERRGRAWGNVRASETSAYFEVVEQEPLSVQNGSKGQHAATSIESSNPIFNIPNFYC